MLHSIYPTITFTCNHLTIYFFMFIFVTPIFIYLVPIDICSYLFTQPSMDQSISLSTYNICLSTFNIINSNSFLLLSKIKSSTFENTRLWSNQTIEILSRGRFPNALCSSCQMLISEPKLYLRSWFDINRFRSRNIGSGSVTFLVINPNVTGTTTTRVIETND